jgi:septum site-determining protein MinC
MVLHVRETNPELLYPQLEKKIGPARSFFANAPLVIDLKAVAEEDQPALDLQYLAGFLRGLGLVPVGVRGQSAAVADRALAAGLGLLATTKTEKAVTGPEETPTAAAQETVPETLPTAAPTQEPPAPVRAATMVIAHPVRSGQQVVAPDGDLVILSSVNAGAEVIAAGNIHIYGALRGRAMAGVHGDVSARVFSLQCNPELVAVAGEYVVNDLLDRAVLNQTVIVTHGRGGLRFEVLGDFRPHG